MNLDWDDSEEFVVRAVPPPQAQEWLSQVCTSESGLASSWWQYAESFSAAADRLVKDSPKCARDTDLYPIVFLYRHSLELRLKDIIDVSSRLLGGCEQPRRQHDLVALWKKARVQIERVFSDESSAENLQALEERIKEFNEIDARSDRFRYPFHNSGCPWPLGVSGIDVRCLKNLMADICSLLSAARWQMIYCKESERGLSSLEICAKWTMGTEDPADVARLAQFMIKLRESSDAIMAKVVGIDQGTTRE